MTFLILVSVFFSFLITAAIVIFFFKFHRKSKDEIGVPIHGDMRLEMSWIVFPAILGLVMFGWGAVVYVDDRQPPEDTLDIYVTGTQSTWKVQQPNGHR